MVSVRRMASAKLGAHCRRPGPWSQNVAARRIGAPASRLRVLSAHGAAEPQIYTRDPELQDALNGLFGDTVDRGRKRVTREEIQHHIDRIAELGRRLDLNRVHPSWNDGRFLELITTNTTGVSPDSSVCSLQRLTFGLVGPGGLQVQLVEGYQVKGPLSGLGAGSANGYALRTHFKLLGNGAKGVMTVEASYNTDEDEPARLGVTFNAFKLAPASTDPHSLALWREALAEANPGMDHQGVIAIAFPKPPRAALHYILMEPDLQLSVGGSGDFLAVQRLPPE